MNLDNTDSEFHPDRADLHAVSEFVVETLDRLVHAECVKSVWAIHTAAMARFGFDRLFYGFTRLHTEFGLGPKDDMLVLSNHCDAYLEGFLNAELYLNAPMMAWARSNTGAMSWSWVNQNRSKLTPEQNKVLEFNRLHEVSAGYTISFREAVSRNRGAIALTARPGLSQADVDRVWEKFGREINILNQVSHQRVTSLPWPHGKGRLSARQREVLEWVGDGKTTADIATIMGLTVATVEKHLKKAREALNVETTAQAVMKASLSNQIFLVDTEPPETPR